MKNKKQFLLNYVGNKYTETDKIKDINLDKVKYIVEPFGGSFGFSRYCFYNLNLKNIKYIIYDLDKNLIDFYKRIQKLVLEDNNKIKELMDNYNKIIDYGYEKLSHIPSIQKRKRKCINYKKFKEYVKTIEDINLNYMLNSRLMKQFTPNYKRLCDFEIFKHCEFINKNFCDEDLNNFNNDYFFYLDPPYLHSCNSYYSEELNLDKIYDTLYKIIYTKRKKCIFIHSYNWFIDYVYNKKKIYEYEKLYQLKKHIVKHICYGNCKFNTS